MEYPEIDVIIPLYKPGERFFKLLESLENQSVPVHKIILMNTEEKYYEKLRFGHRYMEEYRNLEVYHLSKREFDHGRTRHKGIMKSSAPIFLCMTQDATPVDRDLIRNLYQGLQKDQVAVAYARQLPYDDCNEIDKYTRRFNYPEKSRIKGIEDLDELGIKTFFCSNVCAMYKREIYDQLGGFIRKTIFNEDMIYAAKAVKAGYRISYAAEAKVYHSHNYSWKEEFHRNFDLGVSQFDHPEAFSGIKSESEGIRLLKNTVEYLSRTGKTKWIPLLYWKSGWKYLGYKLGRNYRKLPDWMVYRFSMNRMYWKER